MTIQEAVASKQEFRLPGKEWLHVGMDDAKSFRDSKGSVVTLTTRSVLRTDWEVKMAPIVIECSWIRADGFAVRPVQHADPAALEALRPLCGKRTRLTIEVID